MMEYIRLLLEDIALWPPLCREIMIALVAFALGIPVGAWFVSDEEE